MTSGPGSDVRFDGTRIRVGERFWTVNYPVADCRMSDGLVCVVYDYTAGPRHQQFRNLEAFDLTGGKLWTAEHPTSQTSDAYVNFADGPSITAWNFAGYICRIDPRSGRLLEAILTK